jgi:predicted MFS family arabinose efflux permease
MRKNNSLDPSFILLAAAEFTWGIGESMFLLFQPIYLTQMGASPLLIGSILSAAGVAMTVAHIPAGYLSDRIGRRPLLIAGWMIGTIAAGLMAIAHTLPIFFIGMLLYSSTTFVLSPMNSYATAARGKLSIGRAVTLISMAASLGAIFGPTLGGLLGDQFGLHTVYFISTGVFTISTLIVWFIKPQPIERQDASLPAAQLSTNSRYIGFLVIGFFIFFAAYLPQPFTPRFLQDARHLSLSEIGLLGTFGGLGNVLLTFLLGQMEARLGFILAQIATGLFALFLWWQTGLGWYALACFLLGGYRATHSLFMAQIRPLVHDSQIGLAYGIAETVNGLTIVLAPILAGVMYQNDPTSIYPLAFAAVITGVLLCLRFAPRNRLAESVPATRVTVEINGCLQVNCLG